MERRQYPRLDIRYPAELVVAARGTVPVLATNLSVSGLSLIVDHTTALSIAPGGLAASPRGGPTVEVRLTLPLRDGTHVKVEATCRVRGLRRAAMDEHHLGLEYETFHGHGYRALEAFVDDWMTYADET